MRNPINTHIRLLLKLVTCCIAGWGIGICSLEIRAHTYSIGVAPKWTPSLPYTSNGYQYYFQFCGDAGNSGDDCQVTGFVGGRTLETVVENLPSSGWTLTRDREAVEFRSRLTYPCANPPWPQQNLAGTRNFSAYFPNAGASLMHTT
jgi:hypothetical protein